MSRASESLTLPQLNWKKATCEVCGDNFDYIGKKRPHTCKKGECLYKFQYNINPQTWASHQPGLFEA
ncbi:MAG TPA: hypothetical protein VJ983_06560 [candidate division Zixibacteria bacterium]|jgi:hypothetical protein|nr:hypothetical protein [candidate division Zixibacteria bacterium]